MLYYPLVHPPEATLFEAALYWDGLTSLVPQGNEHYRPLVGADDLRYLADAGLYEPTVLDDLIWRSDGRELVESVEAGLLATGHRPTIPDQLDRYSRLWQGKIPGFLEHKARERGWIVADNKVAGTFRGDPLLLQGMISALADQAAEQLQAGQPMQRYVPTTSNEFAHMCATAPIRGGGVRRNWMIDIGPVLPVPPPGTPLTKVLKFRAKHDAERQACLESVRQLQAQLRQTVENPDEVTLEVRRKLGAAAKELNGAALKSFGVVAKRVVLVSVATAAPVAAGMIHGGLLEIAAASGAGVGSGIITNIVSARTRQRDHPFSYLHQFEKAMANK